MRVFKKETRKNYVTYPPENQFFGGFFCRPYSKHKNANQINISSMKKRTREIAKVGIFGSKENPEIVTEKDLQEIEETFSKIKNAPIKLGSHWTENRPRLGNVTAVKYDAKKKILYGTIEEQDVLSDAVEQGYYPDVSIGAKTSASDGKMYLHHLAYLGDEPPAIKDLEQSLAEDLKNAEAKETAAADDTKGVKTFPSIRSSELNLSDNTEEFLKKPQELSMTEEEIKAMQAENEALKTQIAEKEKMLSDSRAAQHQTDKEALKKACEGKLTLPELEQIMQLSDEFADGRTITLSDGNKKTEERPVQILARIFQNVPKKVEPGILNLSDTPAPQAEESLSKKMIGNV